MEIALNSRWRACYVDHHLYISLSSDNNGKNHSPCYALKAKPLNARPVDAKRCRSGGTRSDGQSSPSLPPMSCCAVDLAGVQRGFALLVIVNQGRS